MTIRPDDALKYAAALLRKNTEWALDSIAGSVCDANAGHEDELGAIHDAVAEVQRMAWRFGDPGRYSDGRVVETFQAIEFGVSTTHVWNPDPAAEEPQSWRGDLPSGDLDVPSPGIFEVTTNPADQQIHVRVVRITEPE